ncbi:MAG: tRNA pseudouridine(55) synthase TruB [Desulfobacteraceae bacterium]|jgi:tRNA pseudouridine55 synthase
MAYPHDGIVLIDKDEGESSFSVVKRVKRILGVKKAGHAGTLDPFATGLLVVLLGQGTKLSSYLMAGGKTYRATLRLGVETDTIDPTGRVVRTRPVPVFKPEYIKEKASGFIGEIEQVPPAFSALKYEGKRAYKLARKGIQVALRKRKVKIHHLEIISFDLPEVTILVACSGGTYIRSLADDMGKALGSGAHLRALKRLSVGSFSVKDALRSGEMELGPHESPLQDRIIALRDAIPDMEEAQVDAWTAQKIRKGYQPKYEDLHKELPLPDHYAGDMKLVKGTELVAIVKTSWDLNAGESWSKVVRVFH